MRGLWLKLALIFVGAVFAVMLVATGITYLVISIGDTDRITGFMARHIVMTADFLVEGQLPPLPRNKFRDGKPLFEPEKIVAELPAGRARPELTAALQSALAREGETRVVNVIDTTPGESVAALALDDGRRLLFAFPKPPGPPQELWLGLLAWLTLVGIGVTLVALVLARRVALPFAMLEQAVASVGPDGLLPPVPEKGGAEARRMAASLNALSERLKAAMASRMRLVAAAGHDLRTPMTRMRIRAEFLSDEERESWLEDLDELDAIADSAIRLVQEEGEGEDHRPVELADAVRDVVKELSESGLPIKAGALVPATVVAGPLALRRALRNLLTNAATHGGGGEVRIETDGEERLVIEDNGPGIPDEMIGQVFEPFFRANPGRTQSIKGAGLGLAIAREIIERFGGSIEISNRPEGGLRAVLTLPRSAAWTDSRPAGSVRGWRKP